MDSVGVGEEALDLLKYKEAAARLRVSVSTVRRLVASGELERVPIGRAVRTTPESVAAYKKRLREDAARKIPAA